MFISWIRQLFQQPTKTIRRHGPSAKPAKKWSFQLGVEALEDRCVPAFLAPVSFAAGVVPTAIATGDFNGDGHQDIVTVNSTGIGTVSVLLGNGNGTFQAAVSSPAGFNPTQLAVADFNGDGKLDVAVGGQNSIELMMGNGDGTFQAPVLYAVGGVATHISAADFNGDGHPDLVMSTQVYGGTAMVLMNHGDGTFAPPTNLAAGAGAMDVEVGDVNHDGKQDLVIANQFSGSTVSIRLGNGDGTFQSARGFYAGSAPYKLALGDFNHDGNLDIVALNSYTSNSMSLLMGNGDGTFALPTTYGLAQSPNDVQSADFNGDGNLDLIEPTGAGYQVELGRGDGSFYAATNYSASTGSHNAIGDFNEDGVPDVATSSPTGTVVVLVNANNAATTLAGATGFQLAVPATAIAGQAFSVTVTAVDANGNAALGFTGTVAVVPDVAVGSQPLSYTFTAADAGTHTFTTSVRLYTAGTRTVTVTSPFLPAASQSVTVSAAAANHFGFMVPSTSVAGASISLTVSALDAYGNTATGYSGTIRFASNDTQAVLPANYTFTAADAGVASFTATLETAGAKSISAIDTLLPIGGVSAAVTVTPGVATNALNLSGGGGFIGSAHTVTVTAGDAFGNIATGYTGTVHLVSSDPTTAISADVAMVNGVGTFQVTPMTLGTQTLAATDTTNSLVGGTETINVTPGWAARFTMTPLSATTAGLSQTFTVTAFDAFGNLSNVYTGGVLVSTTDLRVGSFYYAFTAADSGVHTFSVALKTAGTQSISVTDYANPLVAVTQSRIAVTSAAAASISVSALHGTMAGVAQTFTVTARDVFGNVATGYTGTLAISSNDIQAAMLSTYTFTTADAGVHTFNVTLKTAGGTTFAVQDVANATNLAFDYSQRDILVTPAALAGIAITAPSNVTAGVAFNVKVSAVDAYGNTVLGYLGKVHFSGPSGVPLDYTFTAADAGSHTFSVTLTSTGTQTLGVADTVTGSLKAQVSVVVKTAATSGGGTATGGTATGGTATGGTGGGKKPVI